MQSLRYRPHDPGVPVTLSICCSTQNHRPFIAACIEGFLDQFCDFPVEILVHDDASHDGTTDVLRDYAARHPGLIRLFEGKDNLRALGVNPLLAVLLPQARGRYVALCDGEDFWNDPNRLSSQVARLEADPMVALTFGRARSISDGGFNEAYIGGPQRDLTAEELRAGVSINAMTAVFRNVFRDQLPPPFLRQAPMWDMPIWAILGQHGSGRFMAELPPANLRLHEGRAIVAESERSCYHMKGLTQLAVAGWNARRGDDAASLAALRATIETIEMTGQIRLMELPRGGVSLLGMLRIWLRLLKGGR